MSVVIVNPGICGLNSTITVESDEMQTCSVKIESECDSIKDMEEGLQDLDGYDECLNGFGDSTVFQESKKHCKHACCPVSSAIIKAIEVEAGLALPKDVEFKISK